MNTIKIIMIIMNTIIIEIIKVIMIIMFTSISSVAETDSGRYDCLYNGQLVSSFHIAVDSHR